jgi:4-hydroxy-2-oxoheptanedioate aldolase
VQALEDSVVALMIEKREAVENLEEILSVGGIDMIVFGANDYSMSIGRPGAAQDPEIQKIRDLVFETALAMGVQPRAEINAPEDAKPFLERGVRHFAIGTDLIVLYRWLDANVSSLRDLVENA